MRLRIAMVAGVWVIALELLWVLSYLPALTDYVLTTRIHAEDVAHGKCGNRTICPDHW